MICSPQYILSNLTKKKNPLKTKITEENKVKQFFFKIYIIFQKNMNPCMQLSISKTYFEKKLCFM